MGFINLKKAKTTKTKIKKNFIVEEKMIWNFIKDRKLYNVKFKKETEIGKYILNFYSPEIKFGIDIDNEKHTKKYEKKRDEYLYSIGVTSLRFTSSDIKSNLEEILKKIEIVVSGLKY